MLFGSDCNNNMLWDVTGIKRGDTVGLKGSSGKESYQKTTSTGRESDVVDEGYF
jgi:hypothetical protein